MGTIGKCGENGQTSHNIARKITNLQILCQSLESIWPISATFMCSITFKHFLYFFIYYLDNYYLQFIKF